MGAWGSGPFENDDALDWADMFLGAPDGEGDAENEEAGKLAYLLGPLAGIAKASGEDEDSGDEEGDEGGDEGEEDSETDEIDADLASQAIAAAEVLAAMHGKPNDELAAAIKDIKKGDADEEEETSAHALARWILDENDDHRDVKETEALELAVVAMKKVRDASELAALWDEAGGKDAKAWRAHMADLIKRLGGK